MHKTNCKIANKIRKVQFDNQKYKIKNIEDNLRVLGSTNVSYIISYSVLTLFRSEKLSIVLVGIKCDSGAKPLNSQPADQDLTRQIKSRKSEQS